MSPPTASPEALSQTGIANQVTSRLHACGHAPLRSLQVSAIPDAILLQGTLPTFYLKQMAQVLAKSVEGVDLVVNDTVVCPPAPPAQTVA